LPGSQKEIMKLPHTICYMSKSKEGLSHDEIAGILDYASEKNNECDVSGILLHSFGNFFQVLEGGKEHITALYRKILKDKRHNEVFEIYNHSTAKPLFMDYQSNFHVLTSNADLQQIRKYLNAHRVSNTSEKLTRILRPFDFFD
ncbi:MAG: BLUF domain-containing protein, partial [Leeuwenhoekiella sp.]